MSQGGRVLTLDEARSIAEFLAEIVKPGCNPSQPPLVAGSVRRGERIVHDIEIVVTTQADTGLWGRDVEMIVAELLDDGFLELRPPRRNGPAYKALLFGDVAVDLFIVRDPALRGVADFIRTGPSGWNKAVVSECRHRGFRFANGALWREGERLATPTELTVFEALGLRYVAPGSRSARSVRWR